MRYPALGEGHLGYGLEVWENVGLGGGVGLFGGLSGFAFGALLLVEGPLFFEDLFEVFLVFFSFGEVLGDGEGALLGVFHDVFDGGGGVGMLFLAAEVAACDLESVEEEAGAFGVEVVGGEADENLGDGGLDGAAILGVGEGEGGTGVELGVAGLGVLFWERLTKIVVVEAELLLAECGRAAAVSAGEDMAALEALGCGAGLGVWPPTGCLVQSLRNIGVKSGLRWFEVETTEGKESRR